MYPEKLSLFIYGVKPPEILFLTYPPQDVEIASNSHFEKKSEKILLFK